MDAQSTAAEGCQGLPPAGNLLSEVEVEVQVLGPVGVRGVARPFTRAGSLDLVVYLAMHRRGATTEGWATALWPDRLPAAPTLHSTVSAARRSLGRSAGGHDHLPRRHGAIQLDPTVRCDWDRLVASAAALEPGAWRKGLSLVRGRPFEGLRSPDWTILEGYAAEVEDRIVQLAIQLAEHDLGAGDGRGAERAVRRALLASPYDERLYRLLLRSADLQGNPAGVESAMAELVRLVTGDRSVAGPPGHVLATPDAAACVHPRTADLYRALTRGRPAAGTPLVRL